MAYVSRGLPDGFYIINSLHMHSTVENFDVDLFLWLCSTT